MSPRPSVLIVEDEPDLAELYGAWLAGRCAVTTVYDGPKALETIDSEIDIVLLDRRMPGLSGDAVLDRIREDGLDCRIAMVTAVEPDFDIIGMGFDDYLVKPVSEDELTDLIDRLLLRSAYDAQLQRFFALASKKALLDGEKTDAERKVSREYARLEDALAVARVEVDETVQALLESGSYRRLCREITREELDD